MRLNKSKLMHGIPLIFGLCCDASVHNFINPELKSIDHKITKHSKMMIYRKCQLISCVNVSHFQMSHVCCSFVPLIRIIIYCNIRLNWLINLHNSCVLHYDLTLFVTISAALFFFVKFPTTSIGAANFVRWQFSRTVQNKTKNNNLSTANNK